MPEDALLARIFEAHPAATFVVDDDVRVLLANLAARALLGPGELVVRERPRRGGDLLHCAHTTDHVDGCGRGEHCQTCVVRTSVGQALQAGPLVRRPGELELLRDGAVHRLHVLVSATPLELQGLRLAVLTVELPPAATSLPVVAG